METEARAALVAAGIAQQDITFERSADLRLAGQYHELTVGVERRFAENGEVRLPDPDALGAAFAAAYTERYGRMLTGLATEATTWRIEARGPEGRVRLAPLPPGDVDSKGARTGARLVYFPTTGSYEETPVYSRPKLGFGAKVVGPAIIEEAAATAVLRPGDDGEINAYGALVVRRGRKGGQS